MQNFRVHPLTAAQVVAILADRAKLGFNHVNFTGGEPTLLPGFLKVLAAAKKLGYRIYVGTNGTLFAGEEFTQKALPLIDELSFSVHWFDVKSCEHQTGRRQHFEVYPLAVKQVLKYRSATNFFFCNIVLNRDNFQDIEKILRFVRLSGYPAQHFTISVIAPEGAAERNYQNLAFSLEEFRSWIPRIVQWSRQEGVVVRFFGVPLCFLGNEYADYSNDMHWEERHTMERFLTKEGQVTLVDIHTPDTSRKRIFVAKCTDCRWRERPCTGVFKKYFDFYPF